MGKLNVDTAMMAIGRKNGNVVLRGKAIHSLLIDRNGQITESFVCCMTDGILASNGEGVFLVMFPPDDFEKHVDIFTNSGKAVPEDKFMSRVMEVWNSLKEGEYELLG